MAFKFEKDRTEFVTCYKGVERSRLVEIAAHKLRHPNVSAIAGGLLALSHLSEIDIRDLYGKNSHFTLIIDPHDEEDAQAKAKELEKKLNRVKIPYDTVDNLQVKILARQANIDPDTFWTSH
jgi:uncharacterized protein YdcH (DUF465 family)